MFAVLAAFTWVDLLPLWDGFDEPHHYGYVQSLRADRSLPRLGAARLTPEVWDSLVRSPVSSVVKANYPMLRTFDDFRANVPPPSAIPPPPPNYESHQAPLVYLLLAPLEALFAAWPIEWRVRILRLFLLATAVCLFWRISSLSSIPSHRRAAFFLILTTEMFLASCGHIANDALAIPFFVWLFFEAERRSRLAIGLLMAGLLVKAYFLALVPVVAWRLRERWPLLLAAGILPALWYGRNLWLYGNLSGMQEQLTPIRTGDLLNAALQLPWHASLGETFRGALWLANNSFNQWSVWQVNVVIAALLMALWHSIRAHAHRRKWLLAFGGIYCAALAYAALQSFVYTRGAGIAASPWYATPLWLLVIMVIALSSPSRWVLSSLIVVWTYWFLATFWFKLIPFYSGLLDGPVTLSNLSRWYGSGFATMRLELGDPLLLLAAVTSILAIATARRQISDLHARVDLPR